MDFKRFGTKQSARFKNLCLGHCMDKLHRKVFAVWTKDCDFDPNFESRPKVIAKSAANESVAEQFPPAETRRNGFGKRPSSAAAKAA